MTKLDSFVIAWGFLWLIGRPIDEGSRIEDVMLHFSLLDTDFDD